MFHRSGWQGVQGHHGKTRAKTWSCLLNPQCLAGFKTMGTEKLVAKTHPIFADENMHASWRPRNCEKAQWEDSTKNHEDHIAGKVFNSLSHHNLVHKFIPMPQAMKIPDAKSRCCQRKSSQNCQQCKGRKLGAKKRSSKRHRKRRGQFILLR